MSGWECNRLINNVLYVHVLLRVFYQFLLISYHSTWNIKHTKNKALPKYSCEWRVLLFIIHLTDISSEIHWYQWKPSYPLTWGWKQTQLLRRCVLFGKSTKGYEPRKQAVINKQNLWVFRFLWRCGENFFFRPLKTKALFSFETSEKCVISRTSAVLR